MDYTVSVIGWTFFQAFSLFYQLKFHIICVFCLICVSSVTIVPICLETVLFPSTCRE